MTRFLIFLSLLCLLVAPVWAEEGIPIETGFTIPFQVEGEVAPARAIVTTRGEASSLRVFYLRDGQILEAIYSIARQDGPVPPPPPPPPPPIDIAYLYVVHDTATDTPQQAAVIDGVTWQKAADAAGIPWLTMTPAEGQAKFPTIISKAAAAGLPCIVSLNKQRVATVRPLPATDAALADLLKAPAPRAKKGLVK